MSRPSAKFCADCFPGALRPARALRPAAPLRGVARERAYATHRRGAVVQHRWSATCPSSAGQVIGSQFSLRASQGARGVATASDAAANPATKPAGPPQDGPMKEYDTRVDEGRLRDDPYQRGK